MKRLKKEDSTLQQYALIAQIIIAFSVAVVWIFRFDNIVLEFQKFGIPDLLRNVVGAAKISLSTLLILGIWYPPVVVAASLLMAFLMLCAQVAHFRVSHPWFKRLPSLGLLLLSLFVAAVHRGLISS